MQPRLVVENDHHVEGEMHHGQKNFDVTAPRSKFYQGGFGRLFPELEPWEPEGILEHKLEEHFLGVATRLMSEDATGTPDDLASKETPDAAGAAGNGNSSLPSGYVYFGQFIDHDITLDVTPLSDVEGDPNRLHNFRTPRLDLDCLYGLGPQAQPYLYEHEGGRFTGRFLTADLSDPSFPQIPNTVQDLPRNSAGAALIGDPRNDENAIVAQIHTAFLLAHNRLVKRAEQGSGGKDLSGEDLFAKARKTLKWLYQWIVWNDFVKRVAHPDIFALALRREEQPDGRLIWKPGYEDDVFHWKHQPFMPVEFSVAAYRFGHTLVRNAYQTNSSKVAGFGTFFPIFSSQKSDELHDHGIGGGRKLTLRRVIQWDWFLNMNSSALGKFPQRARAFDTKLSRALLHMAEDPKKPRDPQQVLNVLAARNLVRGVRMKLPAGADVARALGVEPIELDDDEPKTLWYYVLKEAGDAGPSGGGGMHLGVIGSIIVCATFAGLLKGDPLSWFNIEPGWEPAKDPLLRPQDDNVDHVDWMKNKTAGKTPQGDAGSSDWGLPTIIRLSGLPVDGAQFQQQEEQQPARTKPVVEPAAPSK
jgi:hypothetical protein